MSTGPLPPDRVTLGLAIINTASACYSAVSFSQGRGFDAGAWFLFLVMSFTIAIYFWCTWSLAWLRWRRRPIVRIYRHVCNDSCGCGREHER